MFCPKCGRQNLETSNFCKGCGTPLRDSGQVSGKFSSGGFSSQGFSQGGFPPGGGGGRNFNLIGQVIDGKYLLEAKLGTGGMGDVYRAARQFIGDKVAVKILHPHLAQTPEAAERFRREAQTAVRLKHNNVVSLYDVGVSAHGLLYIVMELAEGDTLRQIISQYKILPLDFVVTVTAQTCAALHQAHKMDIIHRDIKPENIVASKMKVGWQVKVLDFGIAKLQDEAATANSLTVDGNAMGTPQYMSPEQCLGEPLDARSDVYSMGILIYEMLCGEVPFRAAASSAVAIQHIQTLPPPLRSINPNIAPQVEAVVLRALEKRRENRQATALALSQELIEAATQVFRAAPALIPFESRLPLTSAPSPASQTAPLPSEETTQFSSSGLIFTGSEEAFQNEIIPAQTPDVVSPPTQQPVNDPPAETLRAVPTPTEPLLPEAAPEDFPVDKHEPIADKSSAQFAADAAAAAADLNESNDELHSEPNSEHFALSPPTLNSEENRVLPAAAADDRSKNFLYYTVAALGLLVMICIGGAAAWYFSTAAPRGAENEPQSASKTQPATDSRPGAPAAPAGMVFVPGGEFLMGDDKGDEYARPAHKVVVKPFFMDITEVTNEEYQKFVDATGHKPPAKWKGGRFPPGKEKFPVTGVTWDDAKAYAEWAGKRLPTEAEWEFAARGTTGWRYPWGNEWQPEMANADNRTKGMQPVGTSKGASPFGNYDLIGNAWEWTADDARAYPNGKDFPPNSADPKIIRGGCWLSGREDATATFRTFWGARNETDYSNTSFRCVRDATNE